MVIWARNYDADHFTRRAKTLVKKSVSILQKSNSSVNRIIFVCFVLEIYQVRMFRRKSFIGKWEQHIWPP